MKKFKLQSSYRYWFPIEVKVPTGGDADKQTLTAEFEAYGHSAMKAFEDEIASKGVGVVDSEIEFLRRVTKNWRDIEAEDGSELPFNDENLTALLAHAFVRRAMYAAYFGSINGRMPSEIA